MFFFSYVSFVYEKLTFWKKTKLLRFSVVYYLSCVVFSLSKPEVGPASPASRAQPASQPGGQLAIGMARPTVGLLSEKTQFFSLFGSESRLASQLAQHKDILFEKANKSETNEISLE